MSDAQAKVDAERVLAHLIQPGPHTLDIVRYGDPVSPVNIAVECEDCGIVLMDEDTEAVTA